MPRKLMRKTRFYMIGSEPREAGGTVSISVAESSLEHSPTWTLSIQLTTRIGLQGDVIFLGR